MSMTDIARAYAELAHAHGDKRLQAGRWPYLSQRLDDLERDWPGIRDAVIARARAFGGAAV